MKVRTTRSAVALTAAATLVLVAACSSGDEGGDGQATLQLVQSGDANQGNAYQRMADAYEEETGVVVEIVEVPNADLRTRLRNNAQADDLPALAASPSVDPAWTDRLVDLTDLAAESNIIEDLLAEDPTDGLIKAIPSSLTAVGMYLNTDLWEEAGVEFPTDLDSEWTWDEFQDAANSVVEATDAEYGLVMDASPHRLRSFLYQFGSAGVVVGEDSATLDDEGAAAIEYFKDMHDSGFMPSSVWVAGDDPSATFKSGRVAAYYSGSWQVADFTETITDFEWLSVPMPQQPVRATNYGAASQMVVFDGTGVEEEAYDFLAWLYTEDNYRQFCEYSGCLPSIEGLDVTYDDDIAYAFDLYNAEIAATPGNFELQTVKHLRSNYLGRPVDSEPLGTETIRYISGEIELDEAVELIETGTFDQQGG